MGLLILRRKDSGARNCFLGETSGSYSWGKKKCTLGVSGSQGDLHVWREHSCPRTRHQGLATRLFPRQPVFQGLA
jgi:hypothetical protein